MPPTWFAAARSPFVAGLLEPSAAEKLWYEEKLRVKRWKGRLPDGGSWFEGGFAKRELSSRQPEYIRRFLLETRRAEWTHWLTMAPAPLFLLWNDAFAGIIIIMYALAANVPFIIVQRYNRYRLRRVERSLWGRE
ncbi:glycosyl-4,4'-diaponeurosporenoate acyltransferase [Paenibacillus sp. J5C2022]|uniref:glycosyl-4,4'-diaponeurosporenoate acyltransferase CrtO family protein n=1 Tax=Paenibacillus sp. J5C2022 TaxID=2977129 RepID=UPI0021CEC8A8|nr:glycosyl-4,4'-diaponeurosporenoate acyltransferase [Paenibacillus sp. J5C2022]